MNEEDFELNEIMNSSKGHCEGATTHYLSGQSEPEAAISISNTNYGKLCQFTSGDGTRFFPSGKTIERLIPGVYEIQICPQRGIHFEKIPVVTKGLIRFPETNSEKVINEIIDFWEREHLFAKYKLNYKRGIILWGPPGSGKSCTIQLVNQDVINRGGVVFKFTSPGLFREGIRMFREVQPKTPVVVLMEDIDSTIEHHSESDVLQILDGVDQFDKVVFLATTNYPERLGQRIMNRPSRFDKRIKMGHPKADSRRIYLKHIFDEETLEKNNIDLDQWVEDTEDMSIAHLKELFTSVIILGNEYKRVIDTLRSMMEDHPISYKDDTDRPGIGFAHPRKYVR
jgi:hypothetical protein